jgi:predicted Rossmann-fold nucleotide-binding protein
VKDLPQAPEFIAVIGGGECTEPEARLAEQVGREIARKKAVLVCGGLGGVMEAACRGASSEGGMTIGILPGDSRLAANPYVRIPVVTGMGYARSRLAANPYVRIPVVTGMGYARNVIVVKSAQAVIAVGGSYGTLSEIAHARQNGIPVIGLNTWSLSRNGEPDSSIIPAQGAIEAVEKALNLIRSN